MQIKFLYEALLKNYGKQGWWPLQGKQDNYDYEKPKSKDEIYEVAIGAILMQNNRWDNVLSFYKKISYNIRKELFEKDIDLRPCSYPNRKLKTIRQFNKVFFEKEMLSREELLKIWGIGKETADTILLYAYKKAVFPVDAYTKRLFKRFFSFDAGYEKIKKIVEIEIHNFKDLNEFHALIVEHCKKICKKKPCCDKCFISDKCAKSF